MRARIGGAIALSIAVGCFSGAPDADDGGTEGGSGTAGADGADDGGPAGDGGPGGDGADDAEQVADLAGDEVEQLHEQPADALPDGHDEIDDREDRERDGDDSREDEEHDCCRGHDPSLPFPRRGPVLRPRRRFQASARSLSCYFVYQLLTEEERAAAATFSGNPGIRFEYAVLSNIYGGGGLPPLEAGSVIAERAEEILTHRAAGNRLEALIDS